MNLGKTCPVGRLSCPIEYLKDELFFSLVDYRNNYFTNDDPNKIIEFYSSFENREQLIQWMRERPKGVANIHEVDGDSNIIVVIPTGDFNGKYAKECRETIFKGLHIIFVESGGRGDFYFNYAHNCNVGIKKAKEYNPKWIVLSNDDMEKIDDIEKMTEELMSLSPDIPYLIYCKDRLHTTNVVKLSLSTFVRKTLYYMVTRYTRNIISFERKFNIKYQVALSSFPYNMFFKVKRIFPAVGDFAICSSALLKIHPVPYDETFINGGEDIAFSLDINLNFHTYSTIDFKIKSIGGGFIGQKGRMLKDVLNITYLNYKIEQINTYQQRIFRVDQT